MKRPGITCYMETMRQEDRSRTESIDEDDMWTKIFNMVLHKHRPNLALLHVLAVDHTEHSDGPRSKVLTKRSKQPTGR